MPETGIGGEKRQHNNAGKQIAARLIYCPPNLQKMAKRKQVVNKMRKIKVGIFITVRALAALAVIVALTFVLAACSGSGANDLRCTESWMA